MRIEAKGLSEPLQQQKTDTVAQGLQRQIQRTEEQIAKLSEQENLTPEEKQKKKKELEEKLNSLKQQLQQHEIEKKKAEQEEKTRKIQEELEKKEAERREQRGEEERNGMSNAGMHAMIFAGKSMEQANAIHRVKTSMEGEAHRLKGAIAAEESRGGDVSELKSQLGELEGRIGEVTADIVKKYGEANQKMKQAAEMDKKRNDKMKDEETKTEETKTEEEGKIAQGKKWLIDE